MLFSIFDQQKHRGAGHPAEGAKIQKSRPRQPRSCLLSLKSLPLIPYIPIPSSHPPFLSIG